MPETPASSWPDVDNSLICGKDFLIACLLEIHRYKYYYTILLLTLRFPYIALSLFSPGFMWNGKIKMLGHSACIVEYENVFSFAF